MGDAAAVFSQWTDSQLVEYVNGNAQAGGNASLCRDRGELVQQAVLVSLEIERQVLGASSRAPADPKYPAVAGFRGPPPAAAAPTARAQQPSVPRPMPPAGGGRKKALLCGCNYLGTTSQLGGCINDAKCMEYLLRSKYAYPPDCILLMADDHPDPLRRPTRANMYRGIAWLMSDLRPGDSLVFHFSGHGSQQRDTSGEEADGLNETICPADFRAAGEIVDDELNRLLVNPLPQGVKLHAIIDACHSGTVLDLPFSCSADCTGRMVWQAEYTQTRSHKGTAGGFCVQLGASRDSQVAADTQKLSGYASTGAATYCLIQALERRGLDLTYGQLLVEMHNTLQRELGSGGGGGGVGGLMGMLMGPTGGFRGQEPVLSANYAFDLSYKFSL